MLFVFTLFEKEGLFGSHNSTYNKTPDIKRNNSLSLKMCDYSYSYHLHSFYVLVYYICVQQFLCLIPDSVVFGKVCVLWAKSVHSFFFLVYLYKIESSKQSCLWLFL